MRAGVEGLLKVVEEEIITLTFLLGFVEGLVEEHDVILHKAIWKKTFLIRVYYSLQGENNKAIENGGKDTIVSVRDHDRASVRDRAETFFGDEVEETPIKIVGKGCRAIYHLLDHV